MAEGEKPAGPETPPPIQPLPVTVIGTMSTGTGNGGTAITNGQVIKTPDHQPNLVVQVIPPVVAILVRAINVFLNTLLGGMGLVGASTVTAAPSLAWASWKVALAVALSAAIVNGIQSLATIFGNLEKNHPLLTGSI